MVRALNRPVWLRERSEVVFCDNGADFTGQIVDLWAYHLKIWMESSRPETPTNNTHIKSFNGTLLDEFLNVSSFASLTEAQRPSEAWRVDHNESQPHFVHIGITGAEFVEISSLRHDDQVQFAAGFKR